MKTKQIILSIIITLGLTFSYAQKTGDPIVISVCDYVGDQSSSEWLAADCDGDGETNGYEVAKSTDPYDPCSFTNEMFQTDPQQPNTAQQKAYDIWAAADCDNDGILNGADVTFASSKKFIISAWVKEEHTQQKRSYIDSSVLIHYYNVNINTEEPQEVPLNTTVAAELLASGKIIEGWQRIIGVVEVPDYIESLIIDLKAKNESIDCYFDDVRVFPYNGTMKSFVYDENTQRLMAELDENNYATFYEYDYEGGLVRVKKETEEGVYTIQETRSSTVKE